jgi:hypothetical protein
MIPLFHVEQRERVSKSLLSVNFGRVHVSCETFLAPAEV